MTWNGWLQIALFTGVVLLLVRPFGGYLTRVFAGERTSLTPIVGPVERLFYGVAGVDRTRDQSWGAYAAAMLIFNAAGFVLLYLILRNQDLLPFNPQGFGALAPDLAFNTAVSFVTNTNWQSYVGETTMSHLSQMGGLAVQNFLSAATGIALAMAFIRAFAREKSAGIGNFWVDMTRATLYVLLPISIVMAVFFIWQGMPQTLDASVIAQTLDGGSQTIALGPVASQEAIKMLGTNGGGFYNANSAHPFENPTALSNFIQMVSIFSIGAALTNVFGRMVRDERQGWAILGAMAALFIGGVVIAYGAEAQGNPAFAAYNVDQTVTAEQSGGNMEGKEVRYGIANSALFAAITTAASCGAVIAMHDSFTPIGGLVPLFNIMLSEVIVGGVGAGMYGMLLYVIVAIFLAGLMVGRTPEYVGKKIEGRDVKLTIVAIIVVSLAILIGAGIAVVTPDGLAGPLNKGPHGLSEILYAFSSAAGNNGSAFAGISANTVFYNVALGITMIIGRFAMIVPMLAVAGSLAAKKRVPASSGTFPTGGPLFAALLAATVFIVGGLTFLPVLALGPIAEHFAMLQGQLF